MYCSCEGSGSKKNKILFGHHKNKPIKEMPELINRDDDEVEFAEGLEDFDWWPKITPANRILPTQMTVSLSMEEEQEI